MHRPLLLGNCSWKEIRNFFAKTIQFVKQRAHARAKIKVQQKIQIKRKWNELWEEKKQLRNSIFYISLVVFVAVAVVVAVTVVWQGGKSSCNCNFKRKWKMEKICCCCLCYCCKRNDRANVYPCRCFMQSWAEQSRVGITSYEKLCGLEIVSGRHFLLAMSKLASVACCFFLHAASWNPCPIHFFVAPIEMATDLPSQSDSIRNNLLPFKLLP